MYTYLIFTKRHEKNQPLGAFSLKSRKSSAIGKSIWQKGFYDHAVRKEEDIKNIARYIVANPLRTNIVNKLNDYPHWDAIWL